MVLLDRAIPSKNILLIGAIAVAIACASAVSLGLEYLYRRSPLYLRPTWL